MANSAKGGFRWQGERNAPGSQPRVEIMPVANNNTTAIFKGDLVKRVNDGTIVAITTATDAIYGVADGVEQYWDGTGLRKGNYLPAATTFSPTTVGSERESLVRVIVCTPGSTILECDADDGSTITTLAAAQDVVGENCEAIVSGTGDTTSGISGHLLDISTNATTAALGLRIIGIKGGSGGRGQVDNDVTATRAKYLVVVNDSTETPMNTTGT